MKFGVREICNVVLKAKAKQKVGDKIFFRGEPVCYFTTLKTSSMEGAATTVYAQGGRGNARLMAWEGERTVTFTMEDALISPEGLMILTGAGLIASSDEAPVIQHVTETIAANKVTGEGGALTMTLSEIPYVPTPNTTSDMKNWEENYIYVMLMKDGEIVSEPFIATQEGATGESKEITVQAGKAVAHSEATAYKLYQADRSATISARENFPAFDSVLVDYYVARKARKVGVLGASQINITPDKFGGNYYLEASTLFRDTDGLDYPAEFIIPNCKVQSNFTFTMASSGDPTTFTFTMDAFPDYTKFDPTTKVLASIQIIDAEGAAGEYRTSSFQKIEAPAKLAQDEVL